MDNKVAFFGASVTQQKDGYWKYFLQMNPHLTGNNFGYGSMHLNDAGVVYIDDVLKYNPEYCFIDWFSTGYIEYNKHNFDDIKKYVDTLIHKFTKNGVKLIFLTFPDVSLNSFTNKPVDKKEIYKKLNDYIRNFNIPVIDISESFDDLNRVLRDGIHTTQQGSKEYAKLISDEFNEKTYTKISLPKNYPNETPYCIINHININKVIKNKIILEGNSEVIGISQKIGPYTGLLNINGEIYNNWDRWCYYERDMVNMKFKVSNICEIEILQDNFDRSICQHNANWSQPKLLKLEKMYYTGNNLKIKHIE